MTLAHAAPAAGAVPVGPTLVLVVVACAYLTGVRAWTRTMPGRWPAHRTWSCVVGAALVALGLWPAGIDALLAGSTGPATVHAVQHVLLGMAGPAGLALGAPLRLLLGAWPRARRPLGAVLHRAPLRVLAHPVTAAVLATGGTVVLLTTPLYARATEDGVVHVLVHVHLVASGYLFAWAVAGPDPAPRRPGTGTRLAVLVLSAGVHAALAKVLYARAGVLPPGADHAPADLRTAALWMYYGGDVVEVVLAVALMGAWLGTRRRAATGSAGRRAVTALPGVRDGLP